MLFDFCWIHKVKKCSMFKVSGEDINISDPLVPEQNEIQSKPRSSGSFINCNIIM